MPNVDVRLDPNWRQILVGETMGEWEAAADDLGGTAEANAPVLTGELRRSIEASAERTLDGVEIEARATAPYAGFVEHGTRHMEAQPFLRPALMTVISKRYGLGR